MKQKMKKLFLDNWGLKLISLVLAFLLWFVVISIDDPVKNKTLTNIKVNLINTEELEEKGMVWEVLDGTDILRTVSFDAPLSVREVIEPSDIIAQADLGEITVADTVAIEFICPKYSGQITNISGNISNVKLQVESRVTKWIDIKPVLVGTVQEGCIIGNTVLEQNRLEIAGPQSKINEVAQAVVEINVAGAGPGELSAKVDIHLKDAQGNEITYANVTKNTNAIMTTVEVHATEEIPVEYQYMGIPAEGYLDTGVIEANPKTVRIAGTTSALNRINKIVVSKAELDITGATGNLEQVIDLKNYLPNSVYFADNSFDGKAYVTVYVEEIAERKIPLDKEKVTIMNIPEGYVATFPENINMPTVTLYGLQAKLEAIRNLSGTVDVSAWMESQSMEEIIPGLHSLPVEVNVPEGFEMEEEVSVYIEFELLQEVSAEAQTESTEQ